jgi:Rieske Fe-S protein
MAAVVGLALLILVVGMTGLWGTGIGEPAVALEEVRDKGVVFMDEHDLYVVWDEGELIALSADAQHTGDAVLFCRSSGMFESPAHGEKFDRRGYYYGGPARSGLDRYPVHVEQSHVVVDVDNPIPGPHRGAGPAREPTGPFCLQSPPIGEGDAGFFEEKG